MLSFSVSKEGDYKACGAKTINKKKRNKRNCQLALILKIYRVERNQLVFDNLGIDFQ
jgi:hypothetical protein